MEDVSESDALALLAQFEEAPLHVEESFDLIIPAEIQTEEQKRLQKDIVEVFLDDDEDDKHDSSSPQQIAKSSSSATSTIHHRPKNSLLAQLLQSSTTSTYIPSASTGLSCQASQLPNAQITESSPSSVVKDKVIMVLLLVAKIEFNLKQFQQPSKRGVSPQRACYTLFVFQCGCLFLPIHRQTQAERKKLLNSKDDKFSTIWVKEDQNRKTHDKVIFWNPRLQSSVRKPGTVQSVFLFLKQNQTFFLNKSALYRVDALYQKIYQNSQFVSKVNIVHRKQGVKQYFQREKKSQESDIAILYQWVDKVHKSQKQSLVKACSVNKPMVVCEFCNRSFKSMSEKLYHSYLCQWKEDQTFNLEESIRNPKIEFKNTTCDVCQRSFSNSRSLCLHLDSHFNLTHRHLLPCYPCAKVFFTPWSFINHECFKNRKLVRKLHLNPETAIKVDNMYSQIPAELRNQILKCRACDKQCSFFSQLLRYLLIVYLMTLTNNATPQPPASLQLLSALPGAG